jgi:hypothetical protein
MKRLTGPLAVRQGLGLPLAAVVPGSVLVLELAEAVGVQHGIQELVVMCVLIDGPNKQTVQPVIGRSGSELVKSGY